MKELPFQTFERITGLKWPGGRSRIVCVMLRIAGIESKPGSASANKQLQLKLNQIADLGGYCLPTPWFLVDH
jgi:hypothetical protein